MKKTGRMTGFKRMAEPGQAVYRGLRFTGDKFVKTQVIGRFLARDTDSRTGTEQVAVTPANYVIAYDGVSLTTGSPPTCFSSNRAAKEQACLTTSCGWMRIRLRRCGSGATSSSCLRSSAQWK